MLLTKPALCLFFIVCAAFAANAQEARSSSDNQNNRASYEVRLQLLVSSTANTNNKLPAYLAPIEKTLRADFGQNNYQLALTLLNRAAENGRVEIKGVNAYERSQPATETGEDFSTFYDFFLTGFKTVQSPPNEILIDDLQFNLRVPLVKTTIQDGKSFSVVNYERIGISAKPLSLALNEPTIVGTLTTSRPNELIVLVLTVKSNGNADAARTARKN